jgi:hypothetical protein
MGVCTGTFQLPNGSAVANGLYQWKLSQDALEMSVACICPPLFTGQLDTNGNLTATFLFNDVLLTSGGSTTTYQLTLKSSGGGQVWNEQYYLTGTAVNLNTYPPGGSGGSSGGGGGSGPYVLLTPTAGVQSIVNFALAAPGFQTSGTVAAGILTATTAAIAGNETVAGTMSASTYLGLPNRTGLVQATFAGGGSAISAAAISNFIIPVGMTVTGWEMLADRTCTATVAVLGCSYANFPGSLTSITGADIPHITGAVASANFAVSGATWSANLTATSVLQFSVTSASTVQTLAVGLIMSIPYA